MQQQAWIQKALHWHMMAGAGHQLTLVIPGRPKEDRYIDAAKTNQSPRLPREIISRWHYFKSDASNVDVVPA